jgi:sporulation protein YlmC with PRC-barrel domain
MKSYSVIARGLAIAVSAAVIATSAFAQDEQASKLDTKTTGANVRASQLIGMNIQNEQAKSVGEVNDLVIDTSTGQIRYAAVTYGGFLGVGNKMFAVPFGPFKFQQNPDNPDQSVLVLDVTQKQLEGSTGFDEDHWPNFADQNFTSELHKRYGVSVNVNRVGVKVDLNSQPGRNN